MHINLKGDRDYTFVNNQWRRVKTPPPAPKRCRVTFRGIPCWYAEKLKMLFVCEDREPTEFCSKSAAQRAIWHTVQNTRMSGSHEDYEVELIWTVL